jgi:hypothetical protein
MIGEHTFEEDEVFVVAARKQMIIAKPHR